MKGVFQTVNTLLNKNIIRLPTGFSTKVLCDKFVTFFRNKVLKIRQSLDEETHSIDDSVNNEHVDTNVCMSRFDQFSQVSEQGVCKLISGMPSKTCKLDCVPTWLMKEHLNVFLPFITHVINSSFSSAIFSQIHGSCFDYSDS